MLGMAGEHSSGDGCRMASACRRACMGCAGGVTIPKLMAWLVGGSRWVPTVANIKVEPRVAEDWGGSHVLAGNTITSRVVVIRLTIGVCLDEQRRVTRHSTETGTEVRARAGSGV